MKRGLALKRLEIEEYQTDLSALGQSSCRPFLVESIHSERPLFEALRTNLQKNAYSAALLETYNKNALQKMLVGSHASG